MRFISFLFLVVFAGAAGLFAYQNRAQDVAVTVWDRTWLVNLPVMVGVLFAAGMFGGWAIVGGAVAGGLAGKGIGELIDPTTEDNWIREAFRGESDHPTEEELAAARRAFRYGLAAQSRFPGRMFRDIEDDLRAGWEASGETMPWRKVWKSARAGFDRTLELVRPADGSDIR